MHGWPTHTRDVFARASCSAYGCALAWGPNPGLKCVPAWLMRPWINCVPPSWKFHHPNPIERVRGGHTGTGKASTWDAHWSGRTVTREPRPRLWTWLGGRALGLTGTRPLTNLGGDDLLYEMSIRSSLPEAGSSAVTRWVSPISCYKEAYYASY